MKSSGRCWRAAPSAAWPARFERDETKDDGVQPSFEPTVLK
jgi:hypothetical protein